MALLMTVRGLSTNTYNTSEYIRIKIYLLDKNNYNIALIKREFYIVDNLTAKTLIDINIIKLEGIVLNVVRNIITITLYKNLEVLITSANHRPQIKATVFSNKRIIISAYSNIAILITSPK